MTPQATRDVAAATKAIQHRQNNKQRNKIMEKYIKPTVNVVKLDIETSLLAGSLDTDPNSTHDNQRAPRYGRYDEWEYDEEE